MIIDSKGKLFGKVSIIDILIVLIVLAAVAGVAYKFTKSKTASPFVKLDNLEIKFYQEEVPEYVAKAVKRGDLAVESEQNSVFGRVTDIKVDKSVSWSQTPIGEIIQSTKPGYSSVLITIEGKGIYGDSGVRIGNADYYIGRTTLLKVGNAIFYGRIYDIRKKE